jgi:hypothetical protein
LTNVLNTYIIKESRGIDENERGAIEMEYTVHYEIGVGDKVIEDDMLVAAESEARAVEFCGQMLDQQYNSGKNENDVVLLSCEVK